jgi:hypothetical protein
MPGSEKVNKNIDGHIDRLIAASLALGQDLAGMLEKEMKQDAPWQDRTGNARKGLKGSSAIDDDNITITVSHSVDYGVYLELANDGKYAILKPTADKNRNAVYKAYERLWS